MLQGSVRRSGNRFRWNAQLTDAAADAHLWAERFERDRGDPFAVQNEMTSRIAYTLASSWSLRRPPGPPPDT